MTHVVVRANVPGFHCWPAAPEAVAFLRDKHFHLFSIDASFNVQGEDRELEIYLLRRDMLDQVQLMWPHERLGFLFGNDSCEMIARKIGEQVGAVEVTVLEDGQGGARWQR